MVLCLIGFLLVSRDWGTYAVMLLCNFYILFHCIRSLRQNRPLYPRNSIPSSEVPSIHKGRSFNAQLGDPLSLSMDQTIQGEEEESESSEEERNLPEKEEFVKLDSERL